MTGIALKYSKFTEKKDFLNSILTVDKHHSFIFVDYEGKDHLFSSKTIKELLHQINNTLVLTIAVRALEFQNGSDLWRSYLNIITDNSNISLNIVAGHSAYNIDQTVSVKEALHKFLSQVRERTDRPVFLGIENLPVKIIKEICQLYSPVIPFALNGDDRLKNGFSKKIGVPLAIYAPMTLDTKQLEENIDELLPYLLRRKIIQNRLNSTKKGRKELRSASWTGLTQEGQMIVKNSLNELIIVGSSLDDNLLQFKSQNVKIIVGYPAISSIINQQIEEFKIV